MIALGALYQTSHKVLGHSVFCNITKFQSYRRDNFFFNSEKPSRKHLDKNTTRYLGMIYCSFV